MCIWPFVDRIPSPIIDVPRLTLVGRGDELDRVRAYPIARIAAAILYCH
jgi:hypothetical protein